jgi:LacI family transcriptional regulator
MITTQELAILAGVSQSTVSRSLNNSSRISTETKDKIQKLAKQHGYVFKEKKEAPSSPFNNGGIAIILGDEKIKAPLELYIEYLSNEIINQVEKQNFYSVVLPYDASEESFKHIQSVVETGHIKGVVIIYHHYHTALEEYLSKINMPHVYTQYFARNMKKNLNIIDVDHFTGGYLATSHLISLGHKHIATLTHHGHDFEERTYGFRTALDDNNLPFTFDWTIKTGNVYADGYEAMESNWYRLKDCTAIFAQTDLLGIGVINFLADRGFNVPKEYSVVGFDGLPEGEYCRPQLTTVIQPISSISESSLARLKFLIEHKDTSASHFFVQPQLLIRKSTAPLKD